MISQKPRTIAWPVRALAVSILLCLFAGTLPVLGQEIPPRSNRSVNDYAGVLQPAERDALEALNREVWARSKVAITVVVIDDLGGFPIEDYANRLGRAWGIGSRQENRGILFLIAIKDRRVRIENGYGVEGYLPDGRVGEIIREDVIPHFKQDDYSRGIVQGNLRLAELTAREFGFELTAATAPAARRGAQGRGGRRGRSVLGTIFSLLFLVFFVIFAIRHPFLALLLISGMGGRRGGFSSGGFGGGGFGGFGGGSFGGGGASGSW